MLFFLYISLCCVLELSDGALDTNRRKDFYTALVDMVPFVKIEHRLTRPFLELVSQQEARLNKLEAIVDKIDKAIPNEKDSLREITDFLGNPVNSIRLIHRITDFWPNIMATKDNETSILGKWQHLGYIFEGVEL